MKENIQLICRIINCLLGKRFKFVVGLAIIITLGSPMKTHADEGGDVRGYSASQIPTTVGSSSATPMPGPALCGQAGEATWYIYPAPKTGLLVIDTKGTNFNTVLAVFTGPQKNTTMASLTKVACVFTTNYKKDGPPSITLSAKAGTSYYIITSGNNGAKGKVKLNIDYKKPAP